MFHVFSIHFGQCTSTERRVLFEMRSNEKPLPIEESQQLEEVSDKWIQETSSEHIQKAETLVRTRDPRAIQEARLKLAAVKVAKSKQSDRMSEPVSGQRERQANNPIIQIIQEIPEEEVAVQDLQQIQKQINKALPTMTLSEIEQALNHYDKWLNKVATDDYERMNSQDCEVELVRIQLALRMAVRDGKSKLRIKP